MERRSLLMALVGLGLANTGLAGVRAAAAQGAAPVETRKFEFTIDTTEVPELKDWADTLRPIVERWYPIIVDALPGEGYTAPRSFSITIKNVNGVAYASGTRITCAADWFKQHPDDRGAVVHELVHVVQQYRSRRNPSWLVEGVADYIRWFQYEPASARPRPNPARAKYTDSYRTTAALLNYVASVHDDRIVVRLNQAMREGRYQPELWMEYTGSTVEELWDLYLKTLL